MADGAHLFGNRELLARLYRRLNYPPRIGTSERLVGFVHPFRVHVWPVTRTDAERDSLPAANPFVDEVRSAIRASGFPDEHASLDGTVAQSQETVDRDYDGSWFYALR